MQVAILIPTYKTEFDHYEAKSISRVIELYQKKFDIFLSALRKLKINSFITIYMLSLFLIYFLLIIANIINFV